MKGRAAAPEAKEQVWLSPQRECTCTGLQEEGEVPGVVEEKTGPGAERCEGEIKMCKRATTHEVIGSMKIKTLVLTFVEIKLTLFEGPVCRM